MGKTFTQLTPQHIDFISQQKLYFVGTAAEEGKVNISPKGGDSFRVLNANQVVWLNLTGSGNETAAHVQQTPRMTVMFCAFEGAPLILRLYGSATAIHQTDAQWNEFIGLFPESHGSRQLYLLDIDMVQSSCGMSVPFYDYVGDRNELANWTEKQGKAGIEKYWAKKNQTSLDGVETHILELSGVSER